MMRGLEPLCWEERLGEPLEQLPVPGGACKKAGEGLFTRAWSDRTRGDGFKLKEGRFCRRKAVISGRNFSL